MHAQERDQDDHCEEARSVQRARTAEVLQDGQEGDPGVHGAGAAHQGCLQVSEQ